MVKRNCITDPLLDSPITPVGTKGTGHRQLMAHKSLVKQNSVIEQLVVSHPLRPQDFVYPTNIIVPEQAVAAAIAGDSTPMVPGHLTPGPDVSAKIDELLETLPPQRLAGVVTMAVFAGYAALFSLQHVIKVFFGIPDDDSSESHHFSFAITSLYLWNLIFRLGHNVLLHPFSPRMRAFAGLLSMMVSMLLLGVGIFVMGNRSLALLAVAYAFGGIAVGTFETNYSVVLAALGNRTKIYGISGIPLGIFLVIVPGFIAVTSGLPVQFIYFSVVGLLGVGICILLFMLEFPEIDWLLPMDCESGVTSDPSPHRFIGISAGDQNKTTKWFYPVASVGLVFTMNMLFVSAFSPGVLLYLYNGKEIYLSEDLVVATGYFFAVFSSFGFVADVLSRKRIYAQRPFHHPIRYLVLTAMGVAVIVAQIPSVAPIGTLLVFYANGSIYAQSCRWLDIRLEPSVQVIANSVFFFLGDCGSVMGAILIPFIRDAMA